MTEIINIEQLKEAIDLNPAVLVYFYNDTCAPCVTLRPKVSKMVGDNFPRLELCFCNALQMPTAAAEYGIYASPTLLVFFESKETIRESKYISLSSLNNSIKRYYDMIFDE
jgi:thioredoxin 1